MLLSVLMFLTVLAAFGWVKVRRRRKAAGH
jgi:hypothetical protein